MRLVQPILKPLLILHLMTCWPLDGQHENIMEFEVSVVEVTKVPEENLLRENCLLLTSCLEQTDVGFVAQSECRFCHLLDYGK